MVRNERCNNFDMIFGDTSSCFYDGARVPNYEWLKQHTGVVNKCNYYKHTIVAADITSNLFGVTGCNAEKFLNFKLKVKFFAQLHCPLSSIANTS